MPHAKATQCDGLHKFGICDAQISTLGVQDAPTQIRQSIDLLGVQLNLSFGFSIFCAASRRREVGKKCRGSCVFSVDLE